MKVAVVCVLSLVSVVAAAPYSNAMFLRRPRSHGYGSYISPCAAGGVHAIPSYHPAAAYQLNLPVHGYQQPHYGGIGYGVGGYGAPHYREDEETGEEQEMMNFSEPEPSMSENAPMARYVSLGSGGYGHAVGAGIGAGLSQVVAPSPAGAVGVFPGANVGGCNVPLLLSCSPSIVPGRLVKSHYGGYHAPAYGVVPVAGAEAYRGVEHPEPLAEHPDQPEHATTVHETALPATAASQ